MPAFREKTCPPLAERTPPGKRRISCCRRPRPGSVRQGGRRSFSRRYRLMITLPGEARLRREVRFRFAFSLHWPDSSRIALDALSTKVYGLTTQEVSDGDICDSKSYFPGSGQGS